MLSQYSWWDFAKFCLALLIPYYAFVIIKYYREDIRDWISNRGQREQPATSVDEEEDEEVPSFLVTTDYRDQPAPPVAPSAVHSSAVNQSYPASAPAGRQPLPVDVQADQAEPDMSGPGVDDQDEASFTMPILMEADNADEQSVDEFISAAQRVARDQSGVVTPVDTADKPAARIADIINSQQGNPLADYAFNR